MERSGIALPAAEDKHDLESAATLKIAPKKAVLWRARLLRADLAGLETDAPRAGRCSTVNLPDSGTSAPRTICTLTESLSVSNGLLEYEVAVSNTSFPLR